MCCCSDPAFALVLRRAGASRLKLIRHTTIPRGKAGLLDWPTISLRRDQGVLAGTAARDNRLLGVFQGKIPPGARGIPH
jgi:hypothetical protein